MKKLFITASLITSMALQAADFSIPSQNYQLIEWEVIGFGYRVDNLYNAMPFYSALRANLTDNIQVGLKFDVALGIKAGIYGSGLSASSAYYLTGDYRFVNGYKKFRPFVGISIGNLSVGSAGAEVDNSSSNNSVNQSVTVNSTGGSITQSANGVTQTVGVNSGLGSQLRAGFSTQGIRLTLEYTHGFFGAASYNAVGLTFGILLFGKEK